MNINSENEVFKTNDIRQLQALKSSLPFRKKPTKRYMGRTVTVEKRFQSANKDFGAWYLATAWLTENGYSTGSMCHPCWQVAIQKGEYKFPQKWMNFTENQKHTVDGIMVSEDYRNGDVKIYLFV